jgi:hypothetical protein
VSYLVQIFLHKRQGVSESEMHVLMELRLFCFQNATPFFFPFFLVTLSGYTSSMYLRGKKKRKNQIKIQPWCITSTNGLGAGFIFFF